ncbi:MAG: 50S ribosomal protein L23 [Hydrogenophilus thermoluteolus]
MSALKERHYQVLLAPVISEKSTMLSETRNTVVFRVAPDAEKHEIKAAVEGLFNVRVQGVRVVNVKGKVKRFGRFAGRRANVRKAYVTLEPGQELDFVMGGSA